MLLVCDVDGTMTDGKVTYTDSRRNTYRHGNFLYNVDTSRAFSVRDGHGIYLWCEKGHDFWIMSRSRGRDIEKRGQDLAEATSHLPGNVFTNVGVMDKYALVTSKMEEGGYGSYCAVADDVMDIELLRNAEYAFAPSDAEISVDDVSGLIPLTRRGGDHCVRDAIDILLFILPAKG